MSLVVEPDVVTGFARQVDRAAGNVWEIRSYFNRYAEQASSWRNLIGDSD